MLDKDALKRIGESNEEFSCSNSGGAAHLGAIGPFGLLVLADKSLTEHILSVGFKNHSSLLLNPSDQVSVRTEYLNHCSIFTHLAATPTCMLVFPWER